MANNAQRYTGTRQWQKRNPCACPTPRSRRAMRQPSRPSPSSGTPTACAHKAGMCAPGQRWKRCVTVDACLGSKMPTKRSARPTTTSCGPVQHVDSAPGSSPAPPVSHVDVEPDRKCSDALRARASRCRMPLPSIEVRDVRKTVRTPRDDVVRSRAAPELRVRHPGSRSPAPRQRRARPQVVRCAPWPGFVRR